ncbi:AI-2E family transporter [Psychrobacter sp. HD31]|uniref:AI-2E family transporter n=1 Tax=Psychrobacter sp. HD31 TaxID=3112003 RepID=UPI003DA332DB
MSHSSIDPFFRRLFIIVVIALSLLIVYKLAAVIIPFVFAFVLAYFFNPLVKRLAKYLPRWLSILLVYAVISIAVAIILYGVLPLVWKQLQAAWEYVPVAIQWYNESAKALVTKYTGFNLPTVEVEIISSTFVEFLQANYDVEDAQSLSKQLVTSGMQVVNTAGMVVLVPILMFYFLYGWDSRINTWREALPHAYKNKIIEISKDCDKALMSFLQGQLLVMVLLGVIYALQLQLIGLDLGLIIGMTAGIASFVPYLGFGIGFVAAIIAGLFQFGLDWVHLGLIAGAFAVGQMVEGYVLQPLLLGDKIGLSPLWVMFAVLAGAALLGIVGMLIALPVSAMINVMFNHLYQAYLKSKWYHGDKQLNLFEE